MEHRRSSHRPSEPAYHIEDCRILGTWYKLLISGDVLAVEKLLGQIQPWLGPLDIEVQRKCYAVVFIIDFQHIRDFNTCKKNHIYTSYVGKLQQLHI